MADKNIAKALEMLKRKIAPEYFKIAKLVQPGLENSRYFPWILERLMKLDQAKLVLALPDVERDASLGRLELSEGFVKKLNFDKQKAERYVRELYEKGFLYPTRKGPLPPRSMGQWLDTQNNTKYDKALGDEYYALIGLFSDNELGQPREGRIRSRIAVGKKVCQGYCPGGKLLKISRVFYQLRM